MAKGFFKKEQTRVDNFEKPRLQGCGACSLQRQAQTPKLPVQGSGAKGILIVGEVPSKAQDRKGDILTGNGSNLLSAVLKQRGVDLDRDCWKTNAVRCRPEDGKVSPQDILNCQAELWKFIREKKPRLIILLGTMAVQSFIGTRWKQDKLGGINKWRGFVIPDRESRCWVAPTFHPNHVINLEDKQAVLGTIFRQDIKKALSFLDKPVPFYADERKHVCIIEGQELTKYLLKLSNAELARFAFDYETTGLKPQAKGHEIISCAIADEGGAVAFNFPTDKRNRMLFRKIMVAKHIEKIAHHLKYEDTWTNVILGHPVNGWIWDTMLAAHILDNRSGISGLKFQAYIHFGLLDYSSHIDSFLTSTDEDKKKFGGNAFNRIKEADREEILIYNGIDPLITWRLFQLQKKEIKCPSIV